MSTNIEIKAFARDFEKQYHLARNLADRPGKVMVQEDVFFYCDTGRLKLRLFGSGGAELIGYHRGNHLQPIASQYMRSPIADPETTRQALAMTCGIRGTVRKKRTLFIIGPTRIHMDEVEGLGKFIEIEVVLNDHLDEKAGRVIAQDLMLKLVISQDDLIAKAYIDLLLAQNASPCTRLVAHSVYFH